MNNLCKKKYHRVKKVFSKPKVHDMIYMSFKDLIKKSFFLSHAQTSQQCFNKWCRLNMTVQSEG